MDHRQKILNTIEGKLINHIPFVPRLDLWYASNKVNNTLPEKYIDSSLMEITGDLGVCFHSVVLIPHHRQLNLIGLRKLLRWRRLKFYIKFQS